MTFTSYGDLASTFQSRNLSARIRQDMTRLSTELTTGRKTDIATTISGDFAPVAGIERSLRLLTAYKQATDESTSLTSMMQLTLDSIQSQAQSFSQGLIGAVSSANPALIDTTAMDAREKFGAVVSSLNTQIAGRSLFSGAATDQPALQAADDMLADIVAFVSAETTAAGVSARIDEWFNTPGGAFETTGYLGANETLGTTRIGPNDSVQLSIKADDAELRDVLRALAKSAVMADGVLAGDLAERETLTAQASTDILTAVDGMVVKQANLGSVEARIEQAATRNSAERATLELSLNELTTADPYETATSLEALLSQMDTFYTVTARLSKLNFTDYMR